MGVWEYGSMGVWEYGNEIFNLNIKLEKIIRSK
jgi:hypothetical protein